MFHDVGTFFKYGKYNSLGNLESEIKILRCGCWLEETGLYS
jgi:hypothetical protein